MQMFINPRLFFVSHKPLSDTPPTCLLLALVADIILAFDEWKRSNIFSHFHTQEEDLLKSEVALLFYGVITYVLNLSLMFSFAEKIGTRCK